MVNFVEKVMSLEKGEMMAVRGRGGGLSIFDDASRYFVIT